MIQRFRKLSRMKKALILLTLLLIVVALSGCQTFSFYRQAIKGQISLITSEERTDKLIADPRTPADLKRQLELVERLRAFADKNLKLPVDNHYKKYADLHRPYVVWNVEAAPEFSMEPKGWWYPLVGRLEYRGYFSKKAAQDYGASLKQKACDVYIGGASAYSTLGWFKDPILNTFIFEPEADLAEVIFHELGHQRVFARGDTDFNEAFATTVGQEGARRWLQAKGDSVGQENYLAELSRTDDFVHLIMKTREELEGLYGDERNEDGKVRASRKQRAASDEELRREKQKVFERLQSSYSKVKEKWGGNTDYDDWFSHELNNAKLNSVAAYYDLVPGFQRLLQINGGDLEKFYQEASRLAEKPKGERQNWLRTLPKTGSKTP